MKKALTTILQAFTSIFNLLPSDYEVERKPLTEIEKQPHLVYSDFDQVGEDMQKAIKDLGLK